MSFIKRLADMLGVPEDHPTVGICKGCGAVGLAAGMSPVVGNVTPVAMAIAFGTEMQNGVSANAQRSNTIAQGR